MTLMNNIRICHEDIQLGKNGIIMPCRRFTFEIVEVEKKDHNKIMEHHSPISHKNDTLAEYLMEEIFRIDGKFKDNMIVLNDFDLANQDTKRKILESISNFCVISSINKITNEILVSYSNNKNIKYITKDAKENIMNQVGLDFPRMKLYLQYKECTDINVFLAWIEKYKKYAHPIMENLYNLILMLCTQASFFYPYNTIHGIYTMSNSDFYVLPSSDFPTVNIVDNGKTIDIVFRKTFSYTNINSNEVVTKIHTFMVIPIELMEVPSGYIFSGSKYAQCNSCMIYWIKEQNVLVI